MPHNTCTPAHLPGMVDFLLARHLTPFSVKISRASVRADALLHESRNLINKHVRQLLRRSVAAARDLDERRLNDCGQSAAVSNRNKRVLLAVHDQHGHARILHTPLEAAQQAVALGHVLHIRALRL